MLAASPSDGRLISRLSRKGQAQLLTLLSSSQNEQTGVLSILKVSIARLRPAEVSLSICRLPLGVSAALYDVKRPMNDELWRGKPLFHTIIRKVCTSKPALRQHTHTSNTPSARTAECQLNGPYSEHPAIYSHRSSYQQHSRREIRAPTSCSPLAGWKTFETWLVGTRRSPPTPEIVVVRRTQRVAVVRLSSGPQAIDNAHFCSKV